MEAIFGRSWRSDLLPLMKIVETTIESKKGEESESWRVVPPGVRFGSHLERKYVVHKIDEKCSDQALIKLARIACEASKDFVVKKFCLVSRAVMLESRQQQQEELGQQSLIGCHYFYKDQSEDCFLLQLGILLRREFYSPQLKVLEYSLKDRHLVVMGTDYFEPSREQEEVAINGAIDGLVCMHKATNFIHPREQWVPFTNVQELCDQLKAEEKGSELFFDLAEKVVSIGSLYKKVFGQSLVVCHGNLTKGVISFEAPKPPGKYIRAHFRNFRHICVGDRLFDLAMLIKEYPMEKRLEFLKKYLSRDPNPRDLSQYNLMDITVRLLDFGNSLVVEKEVDVDVLKELSDRFSDLLMAKSLKEEKQPPMIKNSSVEKPES